MTDPAVTVTPTEPTPIPEPRVTGPDAPRPDRRSRRREALASASLAAVVALTACGGPEPTPAPTTPSAQTLAQTPSDLFGSAPTNPFTVDITKAPVHGSSPEMMSTFRQQIATNRDAVPINTGHFNSTLWVAQSDTPKVRFAFDNCQKKPETPAGLYDGPAYFVDVPVPTDAQPAKGSDGAMTVWSPATDQLWEFWVAKKAPNGQWSACWGGRIDHVSQSRGSFPDPFGASASGLATVGSAISVAEARRHEIDHAMSLGLKAVATADRTYYPAVRSDGTGVGPAQIPMGARLRLDPDVDVDALQLTPLGKAVARAAQKYGFMVTESSGTVAVGAESGQAEEVRTGTDPWPAILGGVPDYSQLDGFPWDRVRVVEAGYGEPGAASSASS